MVNPLAGKTPQERNKLILASVLGLISLLALYFAFGRGLFGSSTTAAVKTTPSPTPRSAPASNRPETAMPTASEVDFQYTTTPVDYRPGTFGAQEPGRNIFAFYEPPPPCPECPTPPPKPSPTPPVPTPTPIPTPPIQIQALSPQSVYAGQKNVKIEVVVNDAPLDAKIYMNQKQLVTTAAGPQRFSAVVPDNLVANAGPAQIIVQTPDGTMYSNASMFQIQAPPKPNVQYIGMIGRKRYNNDTAYFLNAAPGASATALQNAAPFSARLNDIVASRFRVVDIGPSEVVVEDVSLGFRHKIPLTKTLGNAPGSGFSNPQAPPGFQNFQQPQQITIGPDGIPMINGVPINAPRPNTPQPQSNNNQRRDIDDDGKPDRPSA